MSENRAADRAAAGRVLAYLFSRMEAGEDITGAMQAAYEHFLPDKEPWQSRMITAVILQELANWEAWYAEALRSPDTFARRYLAALLAPLAQEEQTRALGELCRSLKQLDGQAESPLPTEREALLQLARRLLTDCPAPAAAALSPEERQALDALEELGDEPDAAAWKTMAAYLLTLESEPMLILAPLTWGSRWEERCRRVQWYLGRGYVTRAQARKQLHAGWLTTRALLCGSACAGGIAGLLCGSVTAAFTAAAVSLAAAGALSALLEQLAAVVREADDPIPEPLALACPELPEPLDIPDPPAVTAAAEQTAEDTVETVAAYAGDEELWQEN